MRFCAEALAVDCANAAVHFILGSIHAQAGEYGLAEHHLLRALELGADTAEVHIHLGNVYRLQNDWERAEASYRRALVAEPSSAHANYSLAGVLKRRGAQEEALAHLAGAQDAPDLVGDVVTTRVRTLIELDRREEALHVASEAAAGHESNAQVLMALGFAYQKTHRPLDALRCYKRVLDMREPGAELLNNYGIVLQDLGRIEEALASYGHALDCDSGYVLARFHRALARLLIGDYAAGWPEYETRLVSAPAARASRLPRWHGDEASGLTVLAYGEQGLGDEIMFASCLPDLIRAARHVVVECSPRLHGLFARSFPEATARPAVSGNVAAAGEDLSIDAEVPMGSLPLYYRRTRAAFPPHSGYLRADPERVAAWRHKLAELGPGKKIGLSWRGGTYVTRSPLRSIELTRLEPILTLRGAHFISLQYTPDAPTELQALKAQRGLSVTHWPEAIADYEETAALVVALDLTITVCTAVVHLAGALGRPVWVAAPFSPEWRYGFSGDAMPWYPSARVFRQEAQRTWEPVVSRIAQELRVALCENTAPLESPLA